MRKKPEIIPGDSILDGLEGRDIRGAFRGRVRKMGNRYSVDVDKMAVDTENSADIALARLTGRKRRTERSTDGDDGDEDDI